MHLIVLGSHLKPRTGPGMADLKPLGMVSVGYAFHPKYPAHMIKDVVFTATWQIRSIIKN